MNKNNFDSESEIDKLLLICKPCQSGKTSLVIEDIKKLIQLTSDDMKDNDISIIFCDNSLLQTEQLRERIEKENINAVIISSKSDTSSWEVLLTKIIAGVKVIICCSNTTQINNINLLLKYYENNKIKLTETYRFNFFIDEVDKTFAGSNFDHIINWEKHDMIKKITVITATPEQFLKKINRKIPILPLEFSYEQNKYHKIEDSNINYVEESDFSIKSILDKYDFSDDCFLFCPGSIKRTSHKNIMKELNKYGFNVLVINSDGIILYYYDDTEKEIPLEDTNDPKTHQRCELSKWIAKIYYNDNYNLKNKKFAITGNLSIGRGITISSPQLMLTHAIIPNNVNNMSNLYQLVGRICGNMKEWDNYNKPIVFGTKNTLTRVIEYQNKVINLVENAFKYDLSMVCINNYNNSIESNYGIPIKIRFNDMYNFNEFLEKIKKYKGDIKTKLNDMSRKKIMKKLKKYFMEKLVSLFNHNNNNDMWPLDKYKIKNLKIIGYDNDEYTKIQKYPLNKINSYFENKIKYNAEEQNCTEPGDCIFYVLCNNYTQLEENNIKKGDIFVTFLKKID